jgi:hypothetical protein
MVPSLIMTETIAPHPSGVGRERGELGVAKELSGFQGSARLRMPGGHNLGLGQRSRHVEN